jgi:ribosomal protein S12 methylthiotransferase accessory factor YcaO
MMREVVMDLSLLIGVTLDAAQARLASAGEAVERVVETKPPHPVTLQGALRVVRVRRLAEGGVELVVTRERFLERIDRG